MTLRSLPTYDKQLIIDLDVLQAIKLGNIRYDKLCNDKDKHL